jgi:hypothetical protein
MSLGPFRSLFDQCMIQIDHLLIIALCINGFARLQEFIINNTALVPPDTKHGFFAEAIWSWCWRTGRFAGGQPRFSQLQAFKINPLFVTSHNSVQKLLSFLALKQCFRRDFAMEICRSLKFCGTHLPIYWSFPLLINICWLFLVTHLMLLPIAVEFELGHHPVPPAFLIFALCGLPERALSFTLKSLFLNCRNHVSHVHHQQTMTFHSFFLLIK